MNSITMMANIVEVIVVVFVTAAFITLAMLYFSAQKRLLQHALDDTELRREVYEHIYRLRDRGATAQEAELSFLRLARSGATARLVPATAPAV